MTSSIVILIIISLSSGCINSNDDNDNNSQKDVIFNYDIKVDVENNEDFFIYCPIIIKENGDKSDIMDNHKIKNGNVEYQLENSLKGQILNISSDDDLWISFSTSKKLDFYPSENRSHHPFSLMDYNLWSKMESDISSSELGTVWIFLSSLSGNNLVRLSLDLTIGNIHHTTDGYIEIDNGWQMLNIKFQQISP